MVIQIMESLITQEVYLNYLLREKFIYNFSSICGGFSASTSIISDLEETI